MLKQIIYIIYLNGMLYSLLKREKKSHNSWRDSKTVVNENKVGRNDPCPCGSGKSIKMLWKKINQFLKAGILSCFSFNYKQLIGVFT